MGIDNQTALHSKREANVDLKLVMDADVGLAGVRQKPAVGVALRLFVYPKLAGEMGLDKPAELHDGDSPSLAGLDGLVGRLAVVMVDKGFVNGLSFLLRKFRWNASTMSHNPLLPL